MKKVIIKAPLLTQSGYGEQSRFALRSLRSRPDLFDIYIQPLEWGKTSWSRDFDDERKWIDETILKTVQHVQQGGTFDMSLQVTIPNEFQNLAPINIGYTAGIETTKIAHQWMEPLNAMDGIITISSHSKRGLVHTQYEAHHQNDPDNSFIVANHTPTEFVNYPVKHFEELPEIDLQIDTEFNFLCASQFGPRKNINDTIKWFVEEFRDDENVGLIVKTFMAKNCLIDRAHTKDQVQSLLHSLGERKCKVYLIHGDMTDAEMHSLYSSEHVDAFVSLAHGEGFGLTIYEAAYSGVPVIATGWSGQLDFLVDEQGKENFYNVAFDLVPVPDHVVWEGVLTKDSMWANPREHAAKKEMRQCYEDIVSGKQPFKDYDKVLHERFSAEKQYKKFVDIFNGPTQDVDDWLAELSDELIVND